MVFPKKKNSFQKKTPVVKGQKKTIVNHQTDDASNLVQFSIKSYKLSKRETKLFREGKLRETTIDPFLKLEGI